MVQLYLLVKKIHDLKGSAEVPSSQKKSGTEKFPSQKKVLRTTF